MLEERIREIIECYQCLDEVEAITLAGSRASNRADEQSDIDLDIFIHQPISVEQRTKIASKFSSKMEINNEYFGSGDEFFLKDDPIEIDICYFNWDSILDDVTGVMESYRPKTGYTTCFVHNVVNANILFDRTGKLTSLQAEYRHQFPTPLKQKIIDFNYPILKSCFSSYYHQIEKAIKREDLNSILHRVTAFLASYYDIIFAINEMFHPGEKRLIKIIENQCDVYPSHLKEDVEGLISSIGINPDQMLFHLNRMIDEIDRLLKQENLIK